MIRTILLFSTGALLAACATVPEPEPIGDEQFLEAQRVTEAEPLPVEIVETVKPLPLPGQMMKIEASAQTTALQPRDAIAQGRRSALIEPSVDGYVNAIQVYPYTEGALFRLYSSPGQVSDIALQPGETLISVSAGDTVRWVVGDTSSGSGPTHRAHVLVKPISAGIRTNLMIATDRRTYHLELEAVNGAYMAALSWRYPSDEFAELTARNSRAQSLAAQSIETSLSLDELRFDYRVTGDQPKWRPVRVFDDGRQVFIQMPDDIGTMDMPPLFILGGSGEAELVNYRVRSNYYIVDRLFEAAELRFGTKPQTAVRISKGQKKNALTAWFGGRRK